LSSVLLFAQNYPGDSTVDPNENELESNAKYNYYIGEYYYTQGRYNAAEPYFRRSRDLIERRNQVISERRVKPTYTTPSGGSMLEYRVGEGDTLFIHVWQNDDVSQEVTVRPDGRISFPLAGDVEALGKTLGQLKEELTQRLKEYIRAPQVSISVAKLGASKVIILGEVTYPGVYGVSGKRTVLEAVALAGGFTSDAVVSSIILVRGGLQKSTGRRINLNKSLKGKDDKNENNVELRSEDIIFVPKKFISDVNYLVNTVLGPILQGSLSTETLRNAKW